MVRDVERYTEAARVEASILKDIKEADVDGKSCCVAMTDHFMYKARHMCLIFEPLGPSLYEFTTNNSYRGFFLSDIQSFSKQCLRALAFMHGLQLTHTDLKVEKRE